MFSISHVRSSMNTPKTFLSPVFRSVIIRRNSSSMVPPKLPRLPVPELRKTLDKYLLSIQPFLLEDEANGGPSFTSSYTKRLKWAEEFETGMGRNCQQRLIALDKASPYNWLDDNIWLKKTYLEWRAPLLINSNWWLTFINDRSIPETVLRGAIVPTWGGITPWQVRRAAWLLDRILQFKERLAGQELYPETTRTGIWLRDSTSKMFNICRLPQHGCDMLSHIPEQTDPAIRQIVLMVFNFCYTVEVSDAQNKRLPVELLEQRFISAVTDAQSRVLNGEKAVPIGILSADDRDQWATNYQYLHTLSPTNARSLEAIQKSLMVISLDNYTHDPNNSSPSLDSQVEMDAHLHNVRSARDGHNRWFDKSLTLVVENNTRAGAMGEHSPCDALVPSIVADYAVVQEIDPSAFSASQPCMELEPAVAGWERLDWIVDNKIETECLAAEERAKALIQNSDDSAFWFTEYGADWIKDVAKLSPDAYVQIVLQLAWYRSRGNFTATYETVLTRMFQRGRTETLRTLTVDARAFILAMNDPISSLETRRELLHRAIQTHATLTREAATGRGIDRHLLGLRLMLPEDQVGRCDLFNDELFQRSQTWRLSTSGLSAGHQFRGTGFGSPYEDGYGINYLIGPEMIKFCIESKYSSPLTSTEVFKNLIFDALQDIKAVCTAGLQSTISLARL
ncbi:acyltransferase ChoActase/COT/CPT [Hygrophoropsis aurantiaca]|uniref:Acyltransferase ChoActase/COT/CPT n=1 Tax=Hygrophoropsis aurantiaca TaxID=72124 RepID=A0ACB8AKN3_9AGAM|nr:acyltransferase ChoActase/COT/CPT [Hygrophoropsis aurantiaca]